LPRPCSDGNIHREIDGAVTNRLTAGPSISGGVRWRLALLTMALLLAVAAPVGAQHSRIVLRLRPNGQLAGRMSCATAYSMMATRCWTRRRHRRPITSLRFLAMETPPFP